MKDKLILEAYLNYLDEAINPAVVIGGTMALSALTNIYIAYKERIREYGKTAHECKSKCELRYDLSTAENNPDYTPEDIKRIKINRQECIDKCTARYYKEMVPIKEKQQKIKEKIAKLKALRNK
jgi:hypothetical protein